MASTNQNPTFQVAEAGGIERGDLLRVNAAAKIIHCPEGEAPDGVASAAAPLDGFASLNPLRSTAQLVVGVGEAVALGASLYVNGAGKAVDTPPAGTPVAFAMALEAAPNAPSAGPPATQPLISALVKAAQ